MRRGFLTTTLLLAWCGMIRTARSHPKMPVRKTAIQVLGQTGDERAVAFFRELLSKD